MPFLHPEHFRRLMRRHGEGVKVFCALPLSSRQSGRGTYERGASRALEPGTALLHGHIYRPVVPDIPFKVWINNPARGKAPGAGGVVETGSARISWMPDELSLSSPDIVVRVQEELLARETTTLPADGGVFELSKAFPFLIGRIGQNERMWSEGHDFSCIANPNAAGALRGAGLVVTWNSADRPASGSAISVEYRFHPVLYFAGDEQGGGRRSRYGDQSSQSSLLPRSGSLSLLHPDEQDGEESP